MSESGLQQPVLQRQAPPPCSVAPPPLLPPSTPPPQQQPAVLRQWVLTLPPGSAIQVQRLPGRVSIVVEVLTNPPQGEEDLQVVLLHGTERGASP